MSEQIKTITTQTLIPIGLAITVVSLLLGSMFWMGKLSEKVDRNTAGVTECKAWQAQAPTQYQFDNLNVNMNELKIDIKELRKAIDEIK